MTSAAVGSDKQIFGADGQILGQDLSDYKGRANMGVVMERWCPTQQVLGVFLMDLTLHAMFDPVQYMVIGCVATFMVAIVVGTLQ